MDEVLPQKVLNINVGVLGHVDSGKTSLVKALSTSLSTAALDKNPQSQERGITLDLGFSSFVVDIPDHLKSDPSYATGDVPFDKLQFTLVDCPGHASLIRTIIGGAQIIDMMILVIDINRGIQTQTAECVVIGEITTSKLIIVLNKVDMVPADQRVEKIEKVQKRLRRVFSTTKFHDAPMICTSAAVGGERVAAVGPLVGSTGDRKGSKGKAAPPRPAVASEGIGDVVSTLTSMVKSIPVRNTSAPFYFAVDHCFAIKGHGTVLTGTVLSGAVSIHQTIELPDLQEQKKVKSMQMFRKPVKFAQQGDRVGICVTGLDPTAIERGVLAAPGSVPLLSSAIIMAKKVRYFKQACRSKQKFHISVGHTTVVASVMFFGAAELHIYLQQQQANKSANLKDTDSKEWQYGEKCDFPKIDFSWDQDFEYQDDICGAPDEVNNKINSSASLKKQRDAIALSSKADIADDFSAIEASDSDSGVHTLRHGEEAVQFALLVFQHPILVPLHTLAIGSRLETDAKESAVNATHCRIAFYGPVLCPAAPAEAFLPSAAVTKDKPRIFIWKSKEAEILRLVDVSKDTGLCKEAIGWKLFSKEAGIAKYLNLRLETANGEVVGYIHSSFGATGKFKIKFPLGVSGIKPGSRLFLRYKRFIYDKTKAICQTNMGFTPLAERDAAPISIFVELSASITADDLDEGDEEDGNSLTPRFVAGFAIDSDGEDDVQDIAGITHGATQTVTVTATAESSLPVASTLLATPAAEVVQSEEAVKGVPSVELSIPPAGNCRTGTIDSIKPNSNNAGCVCVVSGIFHMEENIRDHVGAIAVSSGGMRGSLVGPYAKMGKCKIEFLSADKVSVGDTIDIVF